MLPDPHHAPPQFPQRPCHQPVPHPVPRQLFHPERPVAPRHPRMTRAPMPETSIHQHHHFLPRKQKIRPPEDRPLPPPARDAVPPQDFHQRQFRVLVPAPPDPRHHLRPLRLREHISHAPIKPQNPSYVLAFLIAGIAPETTPRTMITTPAPEFHLLAPESLTGRGRVRGPTTRFPAALELSRPLSLSPFPPLPHVKTRSVLVVHAFRSAGCVSHPC
jgi:hypothetical protein